MTLSDWVNRDDIEFRDKEAEKSYRRKAQRVCDVIKLRTPDRVPFWFQDLGYFPCKYAGITFQKAAYHPETWFGASKQVLRGPVYADLPRHLGISDRRCPACYPADCGPVAFSRVAELDEVGRERSKYEVRLQ